MPMSFINLAIVDDHALFRKTLEKYLQEQANIHVVIETSEIGDLMRQLETHFVDVLIMDVFSGLDNIESFKEIRRLYPDIRIVALSMNSDMDLISELLDAGICGYISKSDEISDLLAAILGAFENRIFHNKLLTEALYWNKQNHLGACKDWSKVSLSERERRIVQLIWEEKSNQMIADELFLGIRSIEKIRQEIKEKIGAKSTVGLIKYAIQKRIIGNPSYSKYG